MGFRFRRSIKILPGLRLNVSGSGASVSVGPRGLHYTIGPKGTRVTAGIPGTGLSWTQYAPHQNAPRGTGISESPTQPRAFADSPLTTIDTESVEKVSALSTSELAPLLDKAQHHFRLAPLQLIIGLILFVTSLVSGTQEYIGLAALYVTVSIPIAIWLDRYRRSIKIKYEVEGVAKTIAATLSETFHELKSCAAIWNIRAEGLTADWKRNAGATKLNDRKRIALVFGRPTCLRGSVAFPALNAGGQELYFLPDALLLVKGKSVAALAYQDVLVENRPIRFIEEGSVPSDAAVVDQTWKFVNKKGGPDRRFNGNRQLPICAYGEMSLRSESGMNCVIQYSNADAGARFSKAMEILHRPNSRIESRAISQAVKAKRWPTSVFMFVFLVFGVCLEIISIDAARRQPVKAHVDLQPSRSNLSNQPQIKNVPPSKPSVSGSAAASASRREFSNKESVHVLQQSRTGPTGTIQQCLLVANVDERVECLEQFRIQDR